MRGPKGSGVQLRARDIRVRFTWNGTRYELPIDIAPTIANEKRFVRIMAQVRHAIDLGIFRFEDFPDLPQPPKRDEAPADNSWKTYTQRWRASRGELSKAVRDKDKHAIAFWTKKLPDGQATDLAALVPSQLEELVGQHPWPSAKHRNNMIISLRGVCAMWAKDKPHERVSPAAGVGFAKVQKPKPDPWDLEEVELILADMEKHYDERIVAYFEVAFFAGPRPEEEIALSWQKIDRRKRTGLVDTAKHRGELKEIKNHEARIVEFNDRAWRGIERMRKWTELKDHGCVFENPKTGKPWASEADQRDLYLKPTLKRLGIRPRVAYQARATCATMMLMADMNPKYCARQLGHSVRVFYERYADWIDGKANDEQRAKFNRALTRHAEAKDAAA